MKTHDAAASETKPYHHGDLRRGLLESAAAILEREGPSALSLRAVAREAGVSPAAPYYHFRDKDELLAAIAREGFGQLKQAMEAACEGVGDPQEKVSAVGAAYVTFARAHPALYRVMYDCARSGADLPDSMDPDSAFMLVRNALAEAGGNHLSDTDVHLAAIATWCAAHGLAEMAAFKQFTHLKDACGGEEPFLRAIFNHMGLGPRHLR